VLGGYGYGYGNNTAFIADTLPTYGYRWHNHIHHIHIISIAGKWKMEKWKIKATPPLLRTRQLSLAKTETGTHSPAINSIRFNCLPLSKFFWTHLKIKSNQSDSNSIATSRINQQRDCKRKLSFLGISWLAFSKASACLCIWLNGT